VRGFGQANTYDNKLGDQCLILLFILYKSNRTALKYTMKYILFGKSSRLENDSEKTKNRTPLKYAIQNILFGKVCVTGEIQPPTYGLEVRHSTQPALFYECQTNVPLYPKSEPARLFPQQSTTDTHRLVEN